MPEDDVGCGNNPPDPAIAAKFVSKRDGEMSDRAEVPTAPYWYAACNLGWTGPRRGSYGQALRDADEHNSHTGHLTGVIDSYDD